MMKRALLVMVLLSVALTVSGYGCISYAPDDEPVTAQVPINSTTVEVVTEPVIQLSDTESYELCKIAMAEAEGEDTIGKAHVMMVVLNRVADERFPSTIHDVIFQKNQFTPIRNGRYDRVEPNAECYEALDMVIYGWDESQGALYFENEPNPNNWHSRNLLFLFKHGRHRFYK